MRLSLGAWWPEGRSSSSVSQFLPSCSWSACQMAVWWKDGYRGDLSPWLFLQLCFCSVWGRCPAERGGQTLRCAQLSARLAAELCSPDLWRYYTTMRCTESICERVRKKIVEYFKINVPQRQIAKALQISSSTVHNIIKRFRETGEISVRKGQGRRPLLDARGLRALRRHCITHRHDSVIDITKWAQEYFQKPLSVNTIRRAICRCQLKLYHVKRKAYVNMVQKPRRVLWAKARLKWTVSNWKSVLWSDESKFDILVGNHGRRVLLHL